MSMSVSSYLALKHRMRGHFFSFYFLFKNQFEFYFAKKYFKNNWNSNESNSIWILNAICMQMILNFISLYEWKQL